MKWVLGLFLDVWSALVWEICGCEISSLVFSLSEKVEAYLSVDM